LSLCPGNPAACKVCAISRCTAGVTIRLMNSPLYTLRSASSVVESMGGEPSSEMNLSISFRFGSNHSFRDSVGSGRATLRGYTKATVYSNSTPKIQGRAIVDSECCECAVDVWMFYLEMG
jgi:hypothetical protein